MALPPLTSADAGAASRDKINAGLVEAGKVADLLASVSSLATQVAAKANASALTSEIGSRTDGDTALSGRIDTLSGRIDLRATTASLAATNDRVDARATIAALDAERTRATAAEAALSDRVNAKASDDRVTTLSARVDLKANIDSLDAERVRALAAEKALADSIDPFIAPYLDLVGAAEGRPGDARTLFTRVMAGSPKLRAPLDKGTTADGGELGRALRISGADTDPDLGYVDIAPRRIYPVRLGRAYLVQYAFARFQDPTDPLQNAVELRVQNLSSTFAQVSNVRMGDAYGPTVSNGAFFIDVFIGKTGSPGTPSYVIPNTSRYIVPHVRVYGNGHQTDIGTIRVLDVTDALAGGADIASILGRLAKLELSQSAGSGSGFVLRQTWSSGGTADTALSLVTPPANTIGIVDDKDTGRHTGISSEAGYDAATQTVPNPGRYAPVGSPAVWRRTGDTDAKTSAAALLANAVVRTTLGDTDYVMTTDTARSGVGLITFPNLLALLEAKTVEKFITGIADTIVGTSPVVLIPADPDRNNVQIINGSSTDGLLIGFGSVPVEGAKHTFLLPPGGAGYEQRWPRTDVIYAMAKSGNVPVFANYSNRSGTDVVGEALVIAYLARGPGTQTPAQQAVISDFFKDTRKAGVFPKFRAAALLASFHSDLAFKDIASDRTWSRFNSPTYTRYKGPTGDGAAQYIDTNYSLLTDSRLTASSHAFGMFVDDKTQGTLPQGMGNSVIALAPNRTTVAASSRSASGARADVTTVGGKGGLFQVSRSSADGYRFGWKQTLQSVVSANTGFGTVDNTVTILAVNGTQGANQFSTHQVGFAYVAEALTDKEMLDLETAVTKYLTAMAAFGA